MSLPGDELVGRARLTATRAITVRATTEDVWPWITQLRQARGRSVGITALAGGGGVFAWFLYRPLFRPAPGPTTTDPASGGGQVAAA